MLQAARRPALEWEPVALQAVGVPYPERWRPWLGGMHPGSIYGGVWGPSDSRGPWLLWLIRLCKLALGCLSGCPVASSRRMPLCSSAYADAQTVGLMGLTASGLATRMRRSAHRRLAEARTTYFFLLA